MAETVEAELFREMPYAKQAAVREAFAAFLQEGSLYQKHRFAYTPDCLAQIRPEVLVLYCSDCKRENPFRMPDYVGRTKAQPEADIGRLGFKTEDSAHDNSLESRVYAIGLQCTGCKYRWFFCWLQVDKDGGFARKVGQLPEPDIRVPPEVADALGADAMLYKRAKICLNHSYGVAACAYLRRLLENQIDTILETVKAIRRETGADLAEMEEIERIKTGTIASDKISLAGKMLPPSLKVEGDNALYRLWDELSFGIHSGNENACVEIAQEALPAVNYVLITMGAEARKQSAKGGFVDSIKRINRNKAERERSPTAAPH